MIAVIQLTYLLLFQRISKRVADWRQRTELCLLAREVPAECAEEVLLLDRKRSTDRRRIAVDQHCDLLDCWHCDRHRPLRVITTMLLPTSVVVT